MAHPAGSGGCGVAAAEGVAPPGRLPVPTRTETEVPAFGPRLRRRFRALACTLACRSFMERPITSRRSLNSLTASVNPMLRAIPASASTERPPLRSRSLAASRAASDSPSASRTFPYNSHPGHTVHSTGSGVAQVEHQFMVTTGGSAGRRPPCSLILSLSRSRGTVPQKAGSSCLAACAAP